MKKVLLAGRLLFNGELGIDGYDQAHAQDHQRNERPHQVCPELNPHAARVGIERPAPEQVGNLVGRGADGLHEGLDTGPQGSGHGEGPISMTNLAVGHAQKGAEGRSEKRKDANPGNPCVLRHLEPFRGFALRFAIPALDAGRGARARLSSLSILSRSSSSSIVPYP